MRSCETLHLCSADSLSEYRVDKLADIAFAMIDGHQLKLDLYLPTNTTNPPMLVWVHGGNWRQGSKDTVRPSALVQDGYAMASIDYRLSPIARFPAQIHDTKAAIRFLRAKATRYGYDGSRIGIMGSSAGAHLAVLAGVTNRETAYEGTVGDELDHSSDVQAIVGYYGAFNLTSILGQSTQYARALRSRALARLLGGQPADQPELARMASPVFQVDAGDPPLFLLHGDDDPQMPIAQALELLSIYREENLTVTLEVIHGAGHGGELFYDAAHIAMVKTFLDNHLRATR